MCNIGSFTIGYPLLKKVEKNMAVEGGPDFMFVACSTKFVDPLL